MNKKIFVINIINIKFLYEMLVTKKFYLKPYLISEHLISKVKISNAVDDKAWHMLSTIVYVTPGNESLQKNT